MSPLLVALGNQDEYKEYFISTRVLGWGGFVFGLIATILAVLSYVSTEKSRKVTHQLEVDRLVYESMDLLLFKTVGSGTLAWNIQRGKVLTSEEDKGRLEKARRKIASLKTLDPEKEELSILMFSYFAQFGDINEAIKILADEFEEENRSDLLLMAAIFQANIKESVEPAREYLNLAIKDDSENPELYRIYGNILHSFGKNTDAESQLKTALKLLPNNARITNDLAHVYSESDQLEKAERLLEILIGKGLADGRTYNSLGMINFYGDNQEKAVSYYEKAVELNPEIGLFHKNLSLAYAKAGDDNRANLHKRFASQDGRLPKSILNGNLAYQ